MTSDNSETPFSLKSTRRKSTAPAATESAPAPPKSRPNVILDRAMSASAPPGARGGSPLVTALFNTINHFDSATQIRQSLALAYWPSVVGEQMAAASRPESVRDGILFVRTKSSVWSHEFTFH